MTPEQVKQLVEQHPNLSQEQKDKNPEGGDADAEPARGHYLEQYRATVVRQFPLNAEDALTLHSAGTKKKQ
jgi:hypothetical protein